MVRDWGAIFSPRMDLSPFKVKLPRNNFRDSHVISKKVPLMQQARIPNAESGTVNGNRIKYNCEEESLRF